MSAKESSGQKNNQPEQQRVKRPEAEQTKLESPPTGLEQKSALDLPDVPTTRRMRQTHILRMQQQHGNAYVQRQLRRSQRPTQRVQGSMVQRGFFDSISSGLQAAGGAISSGVKAVGEAAGSLGQDQTPQSLIVDDETTELVSGQMRKQEFLNKLEAAVCATSDEALSGTIYSAVGCPYIARVFSRLPNQSAAHIERMIHLFAPGTQGATAAEAYITPITNRARVGIANWLTTGEVTGVPPVLASLGEAAAETVDTSSSGQGNNQTIHLQADETVSREPELRKVQQVLGEGRPLESSTRSRMEQGFGQSFNDVIIHTDAQTAQLAREQDARAFTVGQHIAFDSGEYQPGTMIGDALLAHELAHTIQQKDSTPSLQRAGEKTTALESDADHAAMNSMARLWGSTKGKWADLQQYTLPRFRTGLQLQRCNKSRNHAERKAAAKQINSLLSDPDNNADEIISSINELGGNAGTVLQFVPRLQEDEKIRVLAGTERGNDILEYVIKAFRSGDFASKLRGDAIQQFLDEARAEPENVSGNTQKAIERINKALQADPHLSKYETVLKLPVTLLPGIPMTGGVYYDSSMPKQTDTKTHVGETEFVSWADDEKRLHYPVIYIKLGPRALTHSDNYIRSTFWHEFQHYQQYVEFRLPDSEQTEESRNLEAETKAGNRVNEELEATSIQLASDFDMLNDDEVKSVVRYLAEYIAEPGALSAMKTAAINRIMAALGSDQAKLERMLTIIESVSSDEQKALAPLAKAIEAKLPPKKKRRHKKSKRK